MDANATMEDAMQRDRVEHPGCQYSQQSSQSYQFVNGESVSQRVQRVMRHCRGEPPVEIYKNRVQESGESSARNPSTPAFDDFFQEFARPLEGLLGSMLSGNSMFRQKGMFPDLPSEIQSHGMQRPQEFRQQGENNDGRQYGTYSNSQTPNLPDHIIRGKVEEV